MWIRRGSTGAVRALAAGAVMVMAVVVTVTVRMAPAGAGASEPSGSTAGVLVGATSASSPASVALQVFGRLSPAQRIGQLFMVGTPAQGLSAATADTLTRFHVGNVLLTGRTYAGASSVRALTARADWLTTPAATGGVPLWIAADQEGGYVQVLQGPGFSRMPTALTQGSWSDPVLAGAALGWGRQVRWSGVDLDLAPVMDTVPWAVAATNAPIGQYQREFGFTPPVVADKGSTFLRAMRTDGLMVTAKHFPGLGHVNGNPDVTAGVSDPVTSRTTGDLVPFRAAIAAGGDLVMVSSAYYPRIDAVRPAVFSPTVIGGMLRGDLQFGGVVVSDDLGAARQVQAWSPGARAVDFLAAGGDVVLTVDPSVVPAMVGAVAWRAAVDPAFRARVDQSVLRVLTLKAARGLLGPRLVADGVLGPLTIAALQRWLGVAATGVLDPGTVARLQARVGAVADGLWGPRSMAALQAYLGTYADGAGTWNSRTVAVLQRYLTTQL